MLISKLELVGFRSYEHIVIEPDPRLTVLVGPNAAGKTNAIEALQLLTTGRSFRNPRWADVVRWGQNSAILKLTSSEDGSQAAVDMIINADGTRLFRLNGAPRRRFSDVAGLTPSVVFTPDDLMLAKGPAENRRSAIDELGEQLSKTYGSIKRDYTRTVRQRNALLREGQYGSQTLDALDEQLLTLGVSLCIHRRRLLQRVERVISPVYGELAGGERLDIRYESQVFGNTELHTDLTQQEVRDRFEAILAARRSEELARQTTLAGPHRDDVVFEVDGMDARAFASQGQQRTASLAWKWAEIRVIEDISKLKPVLLLDDVMSELDAARRTALTGLMQGGIQTFVTTTNTGYFDPQLLAQARVVEISRS